MVRAAYAELLDDYPERFAGIQIHAGDAYATAWGDSRRSFYGGGGYPTTVQDGLLKRIGAFSIPIYISDFTSRMSVSTDVTIELGAAAVSTQTYDITATVSVEATGSAKNMRVHIVQVLDYYPSGTDYRNCFMQAATAQDIFVAPGNQETVTRQFTFSGVSWTSKENMTIVAWASETGGWPSNCEVYQAAVMDWPFMNDCNGNGIPDEDDIADGTSEDCNGNSVPDECEPGGDQDCNENENSDLCDIYLGFSLDCNENAVPDECDIAAGTSGDCNENDIPDECDIASGASDDCDSNGVPDECDPDCDGNGQPDACDIAADPSLDCNHNDIPDSCDLTDCDGSPWCDDCNDNGVLDACDLIADYADDSPELSPLGGDSQVWTLSAPPNAIADVTLSFVAYGDLKYSNEYVDVYLNDTLVGTIYGDSDPYGPFFTCTPDQTSQLTVSAETYNTAKAGGDVAITLDPSSSVSTFACSGENYIQVSTAYVGESTSVDEDDNGIPDECDSPPLCAGDMNCDGVVDFDDIDPFVAALGCAGGDPNCWDPDCPWMNADCSGDEVVTFDDIDPFVARIGATCP